MRINRAMLLKLANDMVTKLVNEDRTIMAIYLQGSLLGESPLIGNTADIDLFLIHSDEVEFEREIIRISDEVHLDLAHHSHRLYRQPRELRIHPWLGPAVYGCKILYDPQHFLDFTQASVRGQFNTPSNVITRVQKQAVHAREMWESFNAQPRIPNPQDIALYLRALEHVANAVTGLNGQCLTERRFLSALQQNAEGLQKPGLLIGFLGLLGASNVTPAQMGAWLPAWRDAYGSLDKDSAPVRLHPYRMLYYASAIESMLDRPAAQDALWPLWHTWTHIICSLPDNTPHHTAWHDAGEQLGLLGASFSEKIEGLDSYLDLVEELIESWGSAHGV